MLMLLAKFEFDGWFHFLKNKELSKKIGFPLKSDDIIMMSSNVHEWKGNIGLPCMSAQSTPQHNKKDSTYMGIIFFLIFYTDLS